MRSEPARQVLERLKGPAATIIVPFNKDYSVDHGALRDWVDFMATRGVPIFILTYGSAEMFNLEDQEILAINQTVAQANRGRAVFVSGTGYWWEDACERFVREACDQGADAVFVHVDHRSVGVGDDLFDFYQRVADKTQRVLLAHTVGGPGFDTGLVKRISKIDNIVGMKNDGDQFYEYYDFIRAGGDDFAVISGGQMRNFFFGYQMGSPAYLCPVVTIAPRVSLAFYEHLVEGRLNEARRLIFDFEEPMLCASEELSWHPLIKSALCLAGHFPTGLRRPPSHSLKPEQEPRVRRMLQELQAKADALGLEGPLEK